MGGSSFVPEAHVTGGDVVTVTYLEGQTWAVVSLFGLGTGLVFCSAGRHQVLIWFGGLAIASWGYGVFLYY